MSDVSFMCTRICASILRLMGVSRTPRDPEYLYPLGKDELHTSVHHLTRSLKRGK